MKCFEQVVSRYTEFLRRDLFELKDIDAGIISLPLDRKFFSEDVLSGNWSSPGDEMIEEKEEKEEKEDFSFKEAAVKRLFFEIAELEENERIVRFAVTMDLCHAMKDSDQFENSEKLWSLLFFELFRLSLGFLKLPLGHLSFWPYVESRLNWFRDGLSVEAQYGRTNLSAIKAPFSKVVFQINKMLQSMRLHSKLLCPVHFKLAMKLHWFLAQCLSPNEQANTNKRGNIAKEVPEQLWDVGAVETDHSNFFSLWQKIQLYFLQDPLKWAFSDPSYQQDFEKYLISALDEVLRQESAFYGQVKRSKAEFIRASKKAKSEIPENLQTQLYEVQNKDTKTTISDGKTRFWQEMLSLQEDSELSLRPLPLDIPACDPSVVISQLKSTHVDFYRKLFLLQILITSNLIETMLTDEGVNKFYQTHDPSYNHNLADDKSKYAKTLTFCRQEIKSRLWSFYELRDEDFHHIMKSIIESELIFMKNKIIRGSKQLGDFDYQDAIINPISKPNHSFKKFGWIQLGNKKIDSIWKIQTGLDQIQFKSREPRELYEELKTSYESRISSNEEKQHDDKVVKQWQLLRSLKSQFMFEFNNVDESTGIGGLFDERLMEASKENKIAQRLRMDQEEQKNHEEKLMKARNYFEEKDKRKRELEDPDQVEPNKKIKVEGGGSLIESKAPLQNQTSNSEVLDDVKVTDRTESKDAEITKRVERTREEADENVMTENVPQTEPPETEPQGQSIDGTQESQADKDSLVIKETELDHPFTSEPEVVDEFPQGSEKHKETNEGKLINEEQTEPIDLVDESKNA